MIRRRCMGCGAILQDTDSSAAGYTPKLLEAEICQRCYRMKHYRELPKIVADNKSYLQVINEVVKKRALMVFIVDIIAFKTTFNPLLIEKLKTKDIILVVNKIDLLPEGTNLERITNFVMKAAVSAGLDPLAIGLLSAKNGLYIEELRNTIELARRERDVYFVGCANVGKSSVINALLSEFDQHSSKAITTSIIPGTTLNQIVIPYWIDNRALIDTPGLIAAEDVLNFLDSSDYDMVVPVKPIKTVTYQLPTDNTIFIGGLLSMSFKCPKPISVSIYRASTLYLHRTQTKNVDRLWKNEAGGLLKPPSRSEIENLAYDTKHYYINGHKMLWFSGFGFAIIKGETSLDVKKLAKTEVYLTDAIIG